MNVSQLSTPMLLGARLCHNKMRQNSNTELFDDSFNLLKKTGHTCIKQI